MPAEGAGTEALSCTSSTLHALHVTTFILVIHYLLEPAGLIFLNPTLKRAYFRACLPALPAMLIVPF
jgi:hypothetical protein